MVVMVLVLGMWVVARRVEACVVALVVVGCAVVFVVAVEVTCVVVFTVVGAACMVERVEVCAVVALVVVACVVVMGTVRAQTTFRMRKEREERSRGVTEKANSSGHCMQMEKTPG